MIVQNLSTETLGVGNIDAIYTIVVNTNNVPLAALSTSEQSRVAHPIGPLYVHIEKDSPLAKHAKGMRLYLYLN